MTNGTGAANGLDTEGAEEPTPLGAGDSVAIDEEWRQLIVEQLREIGKRQVQNGESLQRLWTKLASLDAGAIGHREVLTARLEALVARVVTLEHASDAAMTRRESISERVDLLEQTGIRWLAYLGGAGGMAAIAWELYTKLGLGG